MARWGHCWIARLAVGAIASAAALSSADAAPRAKGGNAVLLLRVEGASISAELAAKLDAAARQQLQISTKGARILPPPALDLEAMKVAAGCGDDGPECLASIGATLGATQVIRIVVSGTKEKSRLTISFVRVKDKKQRVVRADVEDMGEDAIEDFRAQVASALGDKRPAAPGVIVLAASGETGALEGVEVFLDDRKLPLAALRNVPPGEHRLEVHKEGFETVIWTGVVRAGRETRIPVAMAPARTAGEIAEKPAQPEKAASPEPALTEAPRELPRAQPAEPAAAAPDPTAGSTAAVATDVSHGPALLYTWIFVGAAAVATGVGVYYWREQQDIESTLLAECMPGADGKCTNRDYMNCRDFPDRKECRDGHRTQIATEIAFPVAGAFAAAAVAAFFLEDGPMLFGGGSGSSSGEKSVSAAIIPLEGGAAATIGGHY